MADVTEPAKPDAAKLVGYVPAVTVISLFILAVFNIGYFSKIGLHFLGVMDFSNLVYSFSFVVAIVAGSLGASLWGNYLESLVKYSSTRDGRIKILWVVGAFVFTVFAALAAIHFYFPQIEPKHFLVDRLVALGFCTMAILLLAVEYADFKKYNKTEISNGFLTFIVSVLALYYLGRAVAEHEIYVVKTTYEFTVKDLYEPIVGKILRSSSTGFIVFTDDRIMFLPQGEIKRVKATAELAD
jgi:hypothetical protein